jgi:hypothetical protein
MCRTPGTQLGSEPDTGFTAVRGNSIVEQAAGSVDVFRDRDRRQDFVRSDSRVDAINTFRVSASRRVVWRPSPGVAAGAVLFYNL